MLLRSYDVAYSVTQGFTLIFLFVQWVSFAGRVPRVRMFAWTLLRAFLPLFELVIVLVFLLVCAGVYLHVVQGPRVQRFSQGYYSTVWLARSVLTRTLPLSP